MIPVLRAVIGVSPIADIMLPGSVRRPALEALMASFVTLSRPKPDRRLPERSFECLTPWKGRMEGPMNLDDYDRSLVTWEFTNTKV